MQIPSSGCFVTAADLGSLGSLVEPPRSARDASDSTTGASKDRKRSGGKRPPDHLDLEEPIPAGFGAAAHIPVEQPIRTLDLPTREARKIELGLRALRASVQLTPEQPLLDARSIEIRPGIRMEDGSEMPVRLANPVHPDRLLEVLDGLSGHPDEVEERDLQPVRASSVDGPGDVVIPVPPSEDLGAHALAA